LNTDFLYIYFFFINFKLFGEFIYLDQPVKLQYISFLYDNIKTVMIVNIDQNISFYHTTFTLFTM